MKLATRVDSLSSNWTNVHLASKSGDSHPSENETVQDMLGKRWPGEPLPVRSEDSSFEIMLISKLKDLGGNDVGTE